MARLVVLGAVAFGVRLWLLADSSGGLLPVGPDAEDWVIMARAMAAGSTEGLEGNRYPLVPWLVSWAAPLAGISAVRALAWLAVTCGSLGAVVTALVARGFVGPRLAIVAGLWVALAPCVVLAGVSTTAYPLFGLAFLVVVWSVLRPSGPSSLAVAAGASLVLVSCLAQGALCLLAVLPVALFLRRWRWGLAAVVGGGLGLALVWLLHPDPHDPFGWMVGESWRYLAGNVAEERGMSGLGYAEAWQDWSGRALLQPVEWTLALVVLAVVGLALLGRRPVASVEARLPRWLTGVPVGDPPRAGVGVLAWSLLPLVVLLALMASGHHLLYLLPLLVVAALLGLRALMPAAGGVPMTLALALYLGAWSFVAVPSLRIVLGPRLAEDRGLLALGQRVEQAGDAPLLVTLYGPDEVNPVHRGLWACPLGTRVLSVHDRQPERLTWLEGASDVLLVGAAPSEGVRVGPYHLEPVGEGAHIALDRRRSLWVVEAAVQ